MNNEITVEELSVIPEGSYILIVNYAAIGKMSADAIASGIPGNTVKEVTEANIKEIYGKLFP